AKKIEDNLSGVQTLGLLDIDVLRNGYGRQIFSFEEKIDAAIDGPLYGIEATFIRAPKVTRIGPDVKTLATFKDSPVLVRQKNILAASFHAELGNDPALLKYFFQTFCGRSVRP
ncbi:MAG TPA: hypothetical protein VMS71_02405, partial [Candidatus Acidoferrum sp.]|nr:hypothetical protein [Candidatus Acidoferrum sp.]